MIPHLLCYQLVVLGFLWLVFMLHLAWPGRCTTAQQRLAEPIKPQRKRSKEPKPFAGLTHKPPCAACEQSAAYSKPAPSMPPDPISLSNRRPRQVDASKHFCPQPYCA